jgi:hypothetical protein
MRVRAAQLSATHRALPGRRTLAGTPLAAPPPLSPAEPRLSGDVASARRAVASILREGSGPIVVVVKGTNNQPLDNANRATVELLRRQSAQPVSVVCIDYPGAFPPWPDSVGIGEAALRTLLDELRGRTGSRPVYVLAESQGAWVARDVLSDPNYASLVTRTASFAEPAIAAGPSDAAIAQRKLSIRHTDDAITAAPPDVTLLLDPQFLGMAWTLLTQHHFSYDPHDYRGDAPIAARFLLNGERPTAVQAEHQHFAHGS